MTLHQSGAPRRPGFGCRRWRWPALLAGCNQSQQQAGAPPPPAVTVAKPVKRTVIDYDEYVGRFTAVNSVEIRSRLSGYLSAIHFKDGQIVKQGDLLFTIDKRPFQNTLDQMRANLAQAHSNLAFTEADLTRGQSWCRTRPSPTRPSSSARRPTRAGLRRRQEATVHRPSSISINIANCARRSTAASATAVSRSAIW